jgi:NTE family protein
MIYPFENLVFKAGGVKGIAYGGAIQALEEAGILLNIKRVSGSSAGAPTATAVALNYTAEECTETLRFTDFSSFMDGGKNPARLLSHYGLYKGEALLAWLQKLLTDSKYGFEKDATFRDLNKAGCRDLYIFATDLGEHTEQEFSFRTTPDVPVAEACRASMSIPGFFKAWQFPGGKPNDHIFVDGGVLALYPLSVFDQNPFWDSQEEANPGTLGLHLDDLSAERIKHELEFGHFFKYVRDLFETGMKQQQFMLESDPEQTHRTIRIDTLGIKGTDFSLSKNVPQPLNPFRWYPPSIRGARSTTRATPPTLPSGNSSTTTTHRFGRTTRPSSKSSTASSDPLWTKWWKTISPAAISERDLCVSSRIHTEFGGNSPVRFMWGSFRPRRADIFKILSKLQFASTTQDNAIERALAFILSHRHTRTEWVSAGGIKGRNGTREASLGDVCWIPPPPER